MAIAWLVPGVTEAIEEGALIDRRGRQGGTEIKGIRRLLRSKLVPVAGYDNGGRTEVASECAGSFA